jgi:hypothetical protein
VRLPANLRPPARFPLRQVIAAPTDSHLAEWQAVMDQEHPSRLNYPRWRRMFYLHFLRNIVLASGYRDRFRRRAGALDGAFADYFGDDSDESVRKVRLWVGRRLKPKSGR